MTEWSSAKKQLWRKILFFFFALEAHIAPPRQQEVQSRHVQSPVGVPTGTAGSCNKIDDQRLPALFKSCSWFLEYVSFYMNPELFYYQNISAFEFCFFFKSEILSNFGKIVWIYFCLCDKIKSIPLQKKIYIYILIKWFICIECYYNGLKNAC